MRTNKVAVSEIKTRADYVKTLQGIGVGETRSFKMTVRYTGNAQRPVPDAGKRL